MPELDGIETCRALREMPQFEHTIIAFLTARTEDYSQIAGFETGADDYISKPISPPIVKARVKIHIQNYLSKKTLENLLSNQTTSLEDAKDQAKKSLMVFV